MTLLVSSSQDSFVPLPPPVKRTVPNVPFALALTIVSSWEQRYDYLSTAEVSPCSDLRHQDNEISKDDNKFDESALNTLKEKGYSLGLCNALCNIKKTFAKRIFIVDNSGSMQRNDGHRLIENKKRGLIKIVPCSRWEEVRESINSHIRLCGLIQAPTCFRLLNHPGADNGSQIFGVAEQGNSSDRIAADVDWGLHIMSRAHPTGCTPLTDHLNAIYDEVKEAAPMLRANEQLISVTICTDGLPSDLYGRSGPEQNRSFVDSLRKLEGLPVWILIRLCTDDDDVVNFYNKLDGQLEVSIEVLDGFLGKAKAIHGVNPWLNYGLPLHRLREIGFHDRVLDILDERALTLSELSDICGLLFGRDKMDGVPDPSENWAGFRKAIYQVMKTENLQWQNPRTKRMQPWIDITALDFLYGDSCSHLPCNPFQIFRFLQMLRCDQ